MLLNFKLNRLPVILLVVSLITGTAQAQKTFTFDPAGKALNLKPYFGIVEDTGAAYTPLKLLKNRQLFRSVKDFKPEKQTNAFWLITRFSTKTPTDASVYFSHLSYADLYFLADTAGAAISHHRAGAFRPIGEISNGDSRFDFSIHLSADIPYIILIKSRHTKRYPPVFDFYLSGRYQFLKAKYTHELNDLWPLGASVLLLIYIFLRWVTTRYRPFIWLMIFVGAFNLYGIALNRYLIDWFFPSTPIYGWLTVQHFLHLGLIGLFLLLMDSWQMKHKDKRLYKWGKVCIYGLILLSISVFIINYYTSNYFLSTKTTINSLILLLVYAVIMLIRIWKKLDKHELLLAYGLICYILVNVTGSIGIIFLGEQYYTTLPILIKAVSLCIAILFLMGLNGRLKQNEIDKTRYLKKLNLLQLHQNELLEESVNERTKELSQRNAHIETLMNELNHRVKNNLQMLYSLNSLRLTAKDNTDSVGILKDNVSRIKAMMLVNENLQIGENDRPFALKPFIESIIQHSSQIFEAGNAVNYLIDIDPKLELTSKLSLPLGLIVSELIINSYKHAFKDCPSPEISICVNALDDVWEIIYCDNGCGIQPAAPPSFGMQLIHDLIRQIKGTLEIMDQKGFSCTFTISVK